MWSEQITLDYPYRFEEVLKRLSFDPLHIIHLDDKAIHVPLTLDGEQMIVRVTR